MERKTLKFRDHLTKLVLSGEKDVTWRLFDDKNLSEGDEVDLVNWNTKEVFGKAGLVNVYEKKLGDLEEKDFDGHEKFLSEEEMYRTYRTYYGNAVGPETIVKIIKFKLL
ncbi:MAG: ASCH domain-containing protein [Patescibacteria group bacterium]